MKLISGLKVRIDALNKVVSFLATEVSSSKKSINDLENKISEIIERKIDSPFYLLNFLE